MAYGDKIDFGKIKDSRLFYEKPSERSFNQKAFKGGIKQC